MQHRDLFQLFGEDVNLVVVGQHHQDIVVLRVCAVDDVFELPFDGAVVEVDAVFVVGHQRAQRNYGRLLYVFAQEGRVHVHSPFHFIIFIEPRRL